MTDLLTEATRARPTYVRPAPADSATGRRSTATRCPATAAQRGCSLFGWILVALGAIVVAATASPHPLDHQVVEVVGLDHTFVLGAIEIAIGSILLAAATSRMAATQVGIAVGLTIWTVGIVALAETTTVKLLLGAGGAHGCVAIAGGALLLSSSLLSVSDGRGGDAAAEGKTPGPGSTSPPIRRQS